MGRGAEQCYAQGPFLVSTLYTFSDLRAQVLQNLDEAGAQTTDSTYILAGNFINQAQMARLSQETWPFMEWDIAETFTCTTTGRFYSLHQEFWRPMYFFNQATNTYLIETPMRQVPATAVRWNTDISHPLRFRFSGRWPVQTQPTAASTLSIVSDSASDTGSSLAITIRGVTTHGVTSESVTPTGTTAATTVNSYSKILAVTKAASWTGNLTMTSDSGTTTNLFLFPAELGRSYQLVELLSQPGANDVIEYKFFRQPTKLVADNDLPDIPPPHSQILVWDACLLFTGYITDLNQASVSMWRMMEESMETAMKQAFYEGTTAEAEARYVRYVPGDEGSAPFVRSS